MNKHPECTDAKCQAHIKFNEFSNQGWNFYHSNYPMFSTLQLDQVSDQTGTMGMPEVLYGFNRFYIFNTDKDILLEFAPIEALSLSSFAKQNLLYKEKSLQDQLAGLSLNLSEEEVKLN